MKQTLLNQRFQLNLKAVLSLLMLIFSTTLVPLNAQVDCNSIMACIENLNVSLDEDCMAVMEADNIMAAQEYDNSFYTVELEDEAGNIIPDATVTSIHIGMTISATVTLNGCNASCWSSFIVEDKLPPVVDCSSANDLILECTEDPDDNPIPPSAYDACGNIVSGYSDVEQDLGCNTAFSKVITRSWIFADDSGNTTTCDQYIYIKQGSLDDIVWPRDRDDMDLPAYTCGANIPTLDNGAVNPSYSGFPDNVDCGNIQFYYDDIVFPICGSSTKTIRTWTVINWCTGMDTTHNQVIKIMDNVKPVCSAPIDIYSGQGTDDGVCTGSFVVVPPSVVDCSDWDYTVAYKLRDANGDPYEHPVDDNVQTHYNPDGSYYYIITDLPQDTTWVIYTVTDECGNERQCFTEVYIEDLEKPTAICEGYTVVSLDDQGWADIYAESIDDHSWDNCEIDRFEVKRYNSACTGFSSDLDFGEKVNFCCSDVGNGYVKIVMRVYDTNGNFNDCIVNVTVQDKFDPTITCPPAAYLSCTQDYEDLTLTGTATVDDNCSTGNITHNDTKYLNDCGVGYVRRTWTVENPSGSPVSCPQFIYLDNLDPIQASDIDFPGELVVNGCAGGAMLHPDSLNSKPIINNDGCNNLAIGYNDQYFYNVPGYCVKIIRKWSIMDWCSTNSGQGSIIAEQDQIIKIMNGDAPVFTSCENVVVDALEGTCSQTVTVTASATDDCTDAIDLFYSWSIDFDNDGLIDQNGIGDQTTKEFEVGTHKVIFRAKDECDNVGTCTLYVTIGDNKAPTPYCIEEVVWALDENGEAEVWASDFNLKSEDTCPEGGNLRFSFTPPSEGINNSMSFDCDDLDNGVAQLIPLSMYVIDESGNYSYCNVHLNLQDNQDACLDMPDAMGSIGGKITYTNDQGADDLDVKLLNMTNNNDIVENTDADGNYNFEDLGFYDSYMVTADVEKPVLAGVSTLDLLLIQRHILKVKEFEDPFKVIAADVNNSGNVSAGDLISLRKLLLGKIDAFPNNTSWKYIMADVEYEDVNKPWEYVESFSVESLYLSENDANLYALKVGDVDNTLMNLSSGTALENRYIETIDISTNDQDYKTNDQINVDMKVNNEMDLLGMQFTIDFDPTHLVFKGIEGKFLGLTADNLSLELVERGKVLVSWNAINPIQVLNGEILAQIQFAAKGNGKISSSVSISSDGLTAEMYNSDYETININWNVEKESNQIEETLVLKNSPNPFNGVTNVLFVLPTDQIATISIRDLNGKLMKSMVKEGEKGQNSLRIDFSDITVEGVYYYTLETENMTITKKMVYIK